MWEVFHTCHFDSDQTVSPEIRIRRGRCERAHERFFHFYFIKVACTASAKTLRNFIIKYIIFSLHLAQPSVAWRKASPIKTLQSPCIYLWFCVILVICCDIFCGKLWQKKKNFYRIMFSSTQLIHYVLLIRESCWNIASYRNPKYFLIVKRNH